VLLPPNKKIYFLSDFHLGAPDYASSLEREKRIVAFLDSIRGDVFELFIVGDIFDFWYEYRKVIPKGHVRLLGKLAEIADAGTPIHFFVGNHDMWMKDYFQEELNVKVYFGPHDFEWSGVSFHVAHGDGLGPGDHRYKMLKKIFRNRFSQWLFGVFPPYMGMGLANYLSRRSRAQTGSTEEVFLGEENEWLIIYSKELQQHKKYDFLVFGHRHLPIDFRLPGGSRYINLGDWIRYYTYAVFDGSAVRLTSYTGMDTKIIRNW
jgi:UDP-2,3-diacylglucosamine hydrolase